MTVLITGSNGFLGSAVVRVLSGREEPVRCLVRPGSDASAISGLPNVEIIRGTLNRPNDCQHMVEGIDTVYHLAAALGGAPADMFLNSVVATRNLLDAVMSQPKPARFVHCSSFGVYGVADLPAGATIDETTPIERHPEKRDLYSHTKHRQELLVWEYKKEHDLDIVILRPGVVYGPGAASAISNRVGLRLFGIMLRLGRKNLLPLTYVDNCADAIVQAGNTEAAIGEIYNVVDDELVTAKQFLRDYRKYVKKLPFVALPLFATRFLAKAIAWYSSYSNGQLPAILTPYKVESAWKNTLFSNHKLKSIGWQQRISTSEGLKLHFNHIANNFASLA